MAKTESMKPTHALSAIDKDNKQKDDAVLESNAISEKERKKKEVELALKKIKQREEAIAILMKEEKMAKKEKEDFERYEEALLLSYALTQPPINKTLTSQKPKPIEEMTDDEILNEIKQDPILKKEIERVKADALKSGVKIEDKTIVQKYRTTHEIAQLNSLQNQPLKPSEIMAQNRLAAQNKPLPRPDIMNQIRLARAKRNAAQTNTPTDKNQPQQSTLQAAPNSINPNSLMNSTPNNHKDFATKPSPRPVESPQTAEDLKKKEIQQYDKAADRHDMMNRQLRGLQNPSALSGTGVLSPSQIKEQNRQAALKKAATQQTSPTIGLSSSPRPQPQQNIIDEAADLESKQKANKTIKDKLEQEYQNNIVNNPK